MTTTRPASAFLTLWLLSGCVSQPAAQVVWTFETPPGATAFEAPLRAALATAWTARPADYVPRTRHLRADGSPRYINRLFLQSSPYLRQHAHNPLNWHPWATRRSSWRGCWDVRSCSRSAIPPVTGVT